MSPSNNEEPKPIQKEQKKQENHSVSKSSEFARNNHSHVSINQTNENSVSSPKGEMIPAATAEHSID
jgi:hypothetical protein